MAATLTIGQAVATGVLTPEDARLVIRHRTASQDVDSFGNLTVVASTGETDVIPAQQIISGQMMRAIANRGSPQRLAGVARTITKVDAASSHPVSQAMKVNAAPLNPVARPIPNIESTRDEDSEDAAAAALDAAVLAADQAVASAAQAAASAAAVASGSPVLPARSISPTPAPVESPFSRAPSIAQMGVVVAARRAAAAPRDPAQVTAILSGASSPSIAPVPASSDAIVVAAAAAVRDAAKSARESAGAASRPTPAKGAVKADRPPVDPNLVVVKPSGCHCIIL